MRRTNPRRPRFASQICANEPNRQPIDVQKHAERTQSPTVRGPKFARTNPIAADRRPEIHRTNPITVWSSSENPNEPNRRPIDVQKCAERTQSPFSRTAIMRERTQSQTGRTPRMRQERTQGPRFLVVRSAERTQSPTGRTSEVRRANPNASRQSSDNAPKTVRAVRPQPEMRERTDPV